MTAQTQQLYLATQILRDLVAAWRHGEFGTTEGGILGAPTFIQRAIILLGEMNDNETDFEKAHRVEWRVDEHEK